MDNEENQKREVFKEYITSVNTYIKKRRRIIISIGIFIIIFAIVIKIFFGTLELYNIFGYPKNKVRYYEVFINSTQIESNTLIDKKVPIIPYLINMNSIYLSTSEIEGNYGNTFTSDNSEHYYLNIRSYKCYYGGFQTGCINNSQEMTKTKDEKFTNLKIVKLSNSNEIMYDGKLINDIKDYVTSSGTYYIEITSKYKFTNNKIYFYFEN
jgi:hypothetical protein